MGDVVYGLCQWCFQVEDIYLGVGRMSETWDAVCYCDNCENIQCRPIYEVPKICKKCDSNLNSYVPIKHEDEDDEIDFVGGDNNSDGTNYYCPKCKNVSLMFYYSGLWD